MANLDVSAPLWLIGCGNMAGAMLRGWLVAGMDPEQVTVVRPSGAVVAPGVRVVTAIPAEPPPALAMLGVKPQQIDAVAPDLAAALGPDTILVSILAGVEHASLRRRFPAVRTIVRAMPNTPVALRKGATSLYAEGDDASGRAQVHDLMALLGHVEWIADERLFEVVAALAGSGPAFVFRMVDALSAGAAGFGLPPDQALRLAVATVAGAGALVAVSDEGPHALADRVASPGGMTRNGLDVLDADDRLRRLIHETLDAAVRRGREMAEAAREQRVPPR